ncbi:hypothetical protein ACWC2T_45230 [Streptomyces sp. NPDC001393]
MLELVGGQDRVRGRVGPAVGDVGAGVADRVFERRLPDPAEGPLDGGLVTSRPLHPISTVSMVLSG